MINRIIIIYGAGSGLGKSTVTRFIYDHLTRKGIKAKCILEEEVLKLGPFIPYVREVEKGRADNTEVLLSACDEFIEECAHAGQICVVDSILPCSDWLATADCPKATIHRFNARLNQCLSNMRPLFIFLTGDLEIALERAIEDRGTKWAKSLALERCGHESTKGLIAYYQKLRDVSLALLAEWPFDCLTIDTTTTDWKTCQAVLSKHLSGLSTKFVGIDQSRGCMANPNEERV